MSRTAACLAVLLSLAPCLAPAATIQNRVRVQFSTQNAFPQTFSEILTDGAKAEVQAAEPIGPLSNGTSNLGEATADFDKLEAFAFVQLGSIAGPRGVSTTAQAEAIDEFIINGGTGTGMAQAFVQVTGFRDVLIQEPLFRDPSSVTVKVDLGTDGQNFTTSVIDYSRSFTLSAQVLEVAFGTFEFAYGEAFQLRTLLNASAQTDSNKETPQKISTDLRGTAILVFALPGQATLTSASNTAYVTDGTLPSVGTVPLPAAGWLLLGGLATLAAARGGVGRAIVG